MIKIKRNGSPISNAGMSKFRRDLRKVFSSLMKKYDPKEIKIEYPPPIMLGCRAFTTHGHTPTLTIIFENKQFKGRGIGILKKPNKTKAVKI